MYMVKSEFISKGFDLGLKYDVVSFLKPLQYFFIILVPLLTYRNRHVWKLFWLTRLHFDQECHEMIVSKNAKFTGFRFCINVVAIPLNYIILIGLTKEVLRMHLIFNDFLSWTTVQEIGPLLINFDGILLGSLKEAMLNSIWSLVNVNYWYNSQNYH